MKNADGAFMQAFNGQAVVDDTAQIVLAADATKLRVGRAKSAANAGPGRRQHR